MVVFKTLVVLEGAIVCWILSFFVKGANNGTLDFETLPAWLIALAVPVLLTWLAISMRIKGHGGRAYAVLLLLALPTGLIAVFAVHIISWTGRWS
jgi:hypothetical protein